MMGNARNWARRQSRDSILKGLRLWDWAQKNRCYVWWRYLPWGRILAGRLAVADCLAWVFLHWCQTIWHVAPCAWLVVGVFIMLVAARHEKPPPSVQTRLPLLTVLRISSFSLNLSLSLELVVLNSNYPPLWPPSGRLSLDIQRLCLPSRMSPQLLRPRASAVGQFSVCLPTVSGEMGQFLGQSVERSHYHWVERFATQHFFQCWWVLLTVVYFSDFPAKTSYGNLT